MSVIMKILQLIAPLCHNSERILEESDDNQEASNSREITVIDKGSTNRIQVASDIELILTDLLLKSETGIPPGTRLTVSRAHSMCQENPRSCLSVPWSPQVDLGQMHCYYLTLQKGSDLILRGYNLQYLEFAPYPFETARIAPTFSTIDGTVDAMSLSKRSVEERDCWRRGNKLCFLRE